MRRFTNDPTNYSTCCLGLTQDGKTLAVMQDSPTANLWVAKSGALDDARQVSSGETHALVGWTADGKLLTSGSDGHVLVMAPDRANADHLTFAMRPNRFRWHAGMVVISSTRHAPEQLRIYGELMPMVEIPSS